MLKDMIGQEFKVGNYIFYAVRHGDIAALNTGYVTGVDRDKKNIQVQGLDEGWSFSDSKTKRKTRLNNFERIVILHESQIKDWMRNKVSEAGL